ncbi:hypothetical protein WDU94_008675 [Cyamophila willieti]
MKEGLKSCYSQVLSHSLHLISLSNRKEAQKCYCGSKNCRGWIGENPEDEEEYEDEDEEEEEEGEGEEESGQSESAAVESKPMDETEGSDGGEGKTLEKKLLEEKKVKIRRMRKKQRDADYVVDDPEKDLETLSKRGIHNKMDTLAVLRCLVLAETASTRYKVLQLVRSAAAPCRRLLIDYHILKLLYSWMTLSEPMTHEETSKHRTEILETLSILPIPDKTKLKDSNVLQLVTEWSTADKESDGKDLLSGKQSGQTVGPMEYSTGHVQNSEEGKNRTNERARETIRSRIQGGQG